MSVSLNNVGIVVKDMAAAVDFFKELGLEVEGATSVEGDWVDRIIGLHGSKSDITMLRTPDGHSRLELSSFHSPAMNERTAPAQVNDVGVGRIMFAVDDIDATLARLQARGATLVGEVVNFRDVYRLCYVRGPEGVLIALAQQLGSKDVSDVLREA